MGRKKIGERIVEVRKGYEVKLVKKKWGQGIKKNIVW